MDKIVDGIENIVNPQKKKKVNAKDLHEGRERLVKKYGDKIKGQPESSWTKEETVAQVYYEKLTESLHELVPETKNLDRMSRLYEKYQASNILGLAWNYITHRGKVKK